MLLLLLLLLLILINGYFSAVEISMVSVKKFKMQQEADTGNKSAKRIMELLKDPDEYLSSIQVGITLVGLIEGLYGGEVLEAYLEPKFISWGLSSWSAHALSIGVGIGFITYVTIVIGELLPKSIALLMPQKIALRTAPSFRLFTVLAYPFVKLLTVSTHILLRILNIRSSENQKLTDADLKSLLGLAYRQGTLEKNELVLHENIFNLYERTIEKIMTPLEHVILVEETMTTETVETLIRKNNHNYYPVIREKNKIAGYLCAKDFFMDRKSVQEVMRPACTVTPNQKAPDLLQKFKDHNHNFGIVVNGNGELYGVVSMHDIAEVLIGKIP